METDEEGNEAVLGPMPEPEAEPPELVPGGPDAIGSNGSKLARDLRRTIPGALPLWEDADAEAARAPRDEDGT